MSSHRNIQPSSRVRKFFKLWRGIQSYPPSDDIYLVQLSGWNYLLDIHGTLEKYTFYVNRYVYSSSARVAKERALSSLMEELADLLDYRNAEDDPGMLGALYVSAPVIVDDPNIELPKLEFSFTEDVTGLCSPLNIADSKKFQSLMKLGKKKIMEHIEWDYDWPKGVLKPETMEELNRARSTFLEALEIDQLSYGAKFYMGMISAEMNDLKEACRWFEEASELLPHDSDCQRYIGIISGLLGDKKKSIRYLEKAVYCHPLGATCWQNLALAYRKVGRIADARNSIEHALKLDSECPFNRRALVVIQEDESRMERSE